METFETISLHAYGQDKLDEQGQDNDAPPASTLDTSNNFHQRISSADYDRLKIRLHVIGNYAATSEGWLPADFDTGRIQSTWHNLYRGEERSLRWVPFLSKNRGCKIVACVLFGTVSTHLMLALIAYKISWWTTYVPACLALLLALTCKEYVAGEVYRHKWQPSHTSSHGNLYALKAPMLLLICPMMGVPILPGNFAYERSSCWPTRTVPVAILSLQDVISNLAATSPTLSNSLNQSTPGFWRPDPQRVSFDIWSIQTSNFHLGNAYYGGSSAILRDSALPVLWKSLSGPDKYTGPMNQETERQVRKEYFEYPHGEAAIVPVLPMTVPARVPLNEYITAVTKAIGISLSCIRFLPGSEQVVTYIAHDRSISVEVVDSEGCQASFSIESQVIGSATKDILLDGIEKALPMFNDYRFAPNNDFHRTALKRSRDILQHTTGSVLFQPAWTAPSSLQDLHANSSCQKRHFFAAVDPPIAETSWNDSILENLRIQSCVPVYHFANVIYNIHSSKYLDLLSFEPRLDYGFRVSDWKPLPKIYERTLEIFWHEKITNLNFKDETWALGLLKYNHLETAAMHLGMMNTMPNFAVELFAAKSFCSFFSETLSTAIGLTAEETSHRRLNRKGPMNMISAASLVGEVYDKTVLQFNVFFLALFYPAVLIAFSLLKHQSEKHHIESESGLPWSLGSIAGIAALLCRSRLARPLASNRAHASDLHSQPDLVIGQFASEDDHKNYFWKLDTLCKHVTIKLFVETLKITKHDRKCAPYAVRMRAVACSLVFIMLPVAMIRHLMFRDTDHYSITPGLFEIERRYSLIPGLYDLDTPLVPYTFFALALWVLPLSIIFHVMGHLDNVQRFYRKRQPWLELRQSAPASRSLTLDYESGFALLKSLRNRHWVVMIFSIASVVILSLPFLLVGAFQWKWITHPTNINVSRFTWNTNNLTESALHTVETAIAQSLRGMADPSSLPTWVTGSHTFLPAQVDMARDRTQMTGFWQMDTEARRAQLECHEVHVKLQFRLVTNVNTGRGYFVESLTASTPNNDQSIVTIPYPCSSTNRAEKASYSRREIDAVCSRWQLVQNGLDDPYWVIMFTYGAAKHTDDGILFNREPSAIAMSCSAQAYQSNGTISITSIKSFDFKDAAVHEYGNTLETKFNDTNIEMFSKLLNMSNSQPSSSVGTIVLKDPVIGTSQFTGDLLSFMLYRFGLLEMKTPFEPGILETKISKIFAMIYGVFIHDSCTLNNDENVNSQTTLTALRWSETIIVRPRMLHALICITAFIALILILFGVPTKKWMFPSDIDTLEGALYLLYPSSIPKLLEKIHGIEKLPREVFHKRVEGLGNRYMLGTNKEGRFFIDVVDKFNQWDEGFEEEQEEALSGNTTEYHVASESETGPYSDETGDGRVEEQIEQHSSNEVGNAASEIPEAEDVAESSIGWSHRKIFWDLRLRDWKGNGEMRAAQSQQTPSGAGNAASEVPEPNDVANSAIGWSRKKMLRLLKLGDWKGKENTRESQSLLDRVEPEEERW